MYENTATEATREHYKNRIVKDTILRVSNDGNLSRWGNGDFWKWYFTTKKGKRGFDMSDSDMYEILTSRHRVLYTSLNFFDREIFKIDFNKVEAGTGPDISRDYTRGYTLGIDIDSVDIVNGHGANIHDADIKKAVEDMAQFYCDKLREHAPNSVYTCFSGGGIYVFLHHKTLENEFKKAVEGGYINEFTDRITGAYNAFIAATRKEFFKAYPEHIGKVKPDELNNAKRVFKTIFSIHKKYDYSIIPLNPDNVVIDFEAAKLPLKQEVLNMGLKWYSSFDAKNTIYTTLLKPYIEKAKTEAENKKMYIGGRKQARTEIAVSQEPPEGVEDFPPCIQNMLKAEHVGEGATRALAFLAAYLGQAGIERKEALKMWEAVGKRWNAAAINTNVFSSWFKKMHTPSCKTLNTPGPGYPHVDIAKMNFCKPDGRCMQINYRNPVFYADNAAYMAKLREELLR